MTNSANVTGDADRTIASPMTLGRFLLLAAAFLLLALAPGSAAAVAANPAQPDLIVDANFTANTVRQTSETFDPSSCSVQEGSITAGTHKLLRFGTQTANVGSADLRVGHPKRNNANWTFYVCHNHWHFLQYAEYTLTDQAGNVVGVGHKQSFCIEDSWRYLQVTNYARYTCDFQGMSTGWSDIYDSNLDGQWIIVDNVAPGSYLLTITVNYARVLPESNYGNDTVSVPVTVS